MFVWYVCLNERRLRNLYKWNELITWFKRRDTHTYTLSFAGHNWLFTIAVVIRSSHFQHVSYDIKTNLAHNYRVGRKTCILSTFSLLLISASVCLSLNLTYNTLETIRMHRSLQFKMWWNSFLMPNTLRTKANKWRKINNVLVLVEFIYLFKLQVFFPPLVMSLFIRF